MPKKPLSVGVPATLNLKAELERARQECKEGDGSGSASKRSKPKASLALGASSQNKGVQGRAQKDIQALDAERLSRSLSDARARQILEEKAKLYDLLSTAGGKDAGGLSASQLDDPRIAQILDEGSVDFVAKQLEHLRRRGELQKDTAAAGSVVGAGDTNLVEIIDEFGRSRMVPRSEASKYQRRANSDVNSSDMSSDSNSDSSDVEQGESTSRRSRGLGYYNLSLESDERSEQLQALQQLHKHTVLTREEAAVSIGDKQKQQLEERRAKLRASCERFARNA
ncbi:hypothetical protein IWW38_003024 [Coemansia aciculifera]|uniref:Uncharacterized protein n=1 Tax=Coemansia aciculifera TaxID=417176 RepID=A0ACC1M3L2_9FUNG|nr:hypothetical protein IWW38_003024 [Coemansia aciculifera]